MANEGQDKKAGKKAKRPTAQKRQIQNEAQRVINKSWRSEIRSSIRKLRENIMQGKQEELLKELSKISSLVDKAANKGVIKKNKASRIKARLNKRVATKKAA